MSLPLVKAEVVQVRPLTHDVHEVTLACREPATVSFLAGQYVYLTIPPRAPGEKAIKRAYSICSAPSQRDRLTLLANLVPSGPGSHYFFALAVGDIVELHGPTGQFVIDSHRLSRGNLSSEHGEREGEAPRALPVEGATRAPVIAPPTGRDYLFIATGTGIAPLRAMVRTLCERPNVPSITLLWGLRSQRDLYYQEELAALARQHIAFRFFTTLSRPDPGWTGLSGRVTAVIPELFPRVTNYDVYLCGSQAMIRDVKAVLRTQGLCPVHTEKFY